MLSRIASPTSLVTLATLASAAALMLLAPGTARADTLNVPSPAYPTLQAAIDAAQPGDTVLVAAGVYRESLHWSNKDLTLRGAGADSTVINPDASLGGPGTG